MVGKAAIVVDCGANTTKYGLSSQDAPGTFRTVIGRASTAELGINGTFVGNEAQSRRGLLTLSSPFHCGVVKNWDDLERVWRHIFNDELRAADHPVIMTCE